MDNRLSKPAGHARRLRDGRFSEPGRTYFLTKCVEGRRPLLTNPEPAEIIISSLVYFQHRRSIDLLAFVIMSNHYHALFTLREGNDLSSLMRRMGSFTANSIREITGERWNIWQDDGFYDHACRDESEILSCAEYIEHNPVRHCLVEFAGEWPFSSAHPGRRHLLNWDDNARV